MHARSVAAAAIDFETGEVRQALLCPSHEEILGWVAGLPGPVAVAYEAGPTGFWLSRRLTEAGIRCVVAAPSKLIRPSGDHVKTDRRDALHLARLLKLDEVTAVAVPTVEREAARDLVRAREDCRGDLMRARHRLSGQLLRHGVVYYGGKPWTMRHDTWLRAQQLGHRDARAGFEAYYDAVVSVTARRARLDALITERAAEEDYRDLVRRLCCLRGVGTLTGFALAVEIGDWGRFTGSSIGSFVGLVPSEDSSGETTRRGAITKAGNTHARRLLVEAAWHHRRRYLASRALQHRWQASTPAAAARADKGNRRLHRRWAAFDARAKKPTIANTAIARELAAWCWSLAVMD